MAMVDLQERIEVMLKLESSGYGTIDYLSPETQKHLTAVVDVPLSSEASAASSGSSCSSSTITELWREKICEWKYSVIDHFNFSREVVSVSIHYLDRYLATRQVNKKTFQLAAMTCLFLAIKLYEPGRLSMTSMIELSRGYFTVDQMATMEMSILRALSWQVHPPTAHSFVNHILFLLSNESVPIDVRHSIYELARFLTELSVIDYYFVIHKASEVAIAALLNAMDEIPGIPSGIKQDFAKEVSKATSLDLYSEEVLACRQRLHRLYVQGGYACPANGQIRPETISPVCVSYGVNPYAQQGRVVSNSEEPIQRATQSDSQSQKLIREAIA